MAGAGSLEQRQALLGDESEAELWSHVLAMPAKEGPSVQELIRADPGTVIATLQRTGVQQVAEFNLPVSAACARLIATLT
jgi:hypothetical protein